MAEHELKSRRPAMRVGVVGAGWAGCEHVRSLASFAGVELAGIVDADASRAAALARSVGTLAFDSVDELLERGSVDALVVATPPGAHAEPAVAALAQSVAVYLEKPISRSLEDAQAIVEAAARSGVPCAVGYQWRAVDAVEALREQLMDQRIALLVSRGVGITQAREWFHDDVHSSGLLSERGSHHVDLQRHLAGPPSSVVASRGEVAVSGTLAADSAVDDVVCLTLVFRSGAIGMIAVVWTPPGFPGVQEISVVAGDGAFDIELDPSFVLRGTSRGRSIERRTERAPFSASLEDFLVCVREGTPEAVRCSARDAADTLIVTRACEQALDSGGRVSIDSDSVGSAERQLRPRSGR